MRCICFFLRQAKVFCCRFDKNARFGWYRYDSRFALPIFDDDGEVLRYNVFHVELVIRYVMDRKLYLYDIINIKKETEKEKKLLQIEAGDRT